MVASLSDQAQRIAQEKMEFSIPRRWQHVSGVALKATKIGKALFSPADADSLVAAAWLHDIGYAPECVATGFHPLDGALWLRKAGFNERVTALVAHHSCSLIEAEGRGLAKELRAFPQEASLVADALLVSDMTTSPDGQSVELSIRLTEIVARYGEGHIVTRFIEQARPLFLLAAKRIQENRKA